MLVVRYAGTPRAGRRRPTTRSDFSTIGWTITPSGETWTMQEPYGAYTWYAVNDQPSDKAFYDISVTAPSPWVGIANGDADSTRPSDDGLTTTALAPDQAGVVVPRHGRHRRLHAHHRHLAERHAEISYWVPSRPARGWRPGCSRRPPGWTGWRGCSVPTRSTASASCSSTRAAAWRRRP